MTIPILRTDESVTIGTVPPHPERTAMVEADGGLLMWDELADTIYPTAKIFDLDRAADWLWEIYGAESIRGILGGDDDIDPVAVSPVLRAAKRLAHIEWARSWWPESALTGIPRLSIDLLNAEAARHVFAAEHLLDDEDAVQRTLSTVNFEQLVELSARAGFSEQIAELIDQLGELAEDYGVEPVRTSTALGPDDVALAAGHPRRAVTTVAEGEAIIDWSLTPAGVVDAAGTAHWELARRQGVLTVSVSVPMGGSTVDVPLVARLGETEVELQRSPDLLLFFGQTAVATTFLLTPADRRQPVVYSPIMGEPHGPAVDLADRHEDILAHARHRLAAPDGLLAEQIAGAER